MSLQAEMIQKQLLEANMEEGLDYISNKIFAKPLKELSDKEAYYVILLSTKELTLVTDRINGILYFCGVLNRTPFIQQSY